MPNENMKPEIQNIDAGSSTLTADKAGLVGDELIIVAIEKKEVEYEDEKRVVNLYTARNVQTGTMVQFFGSAVLDAQEIKVESRVVLDLRTSKSGRKYYVFIILPGQAVTE